jgi:hypothetical protein
MECAYFVFMISCKDSSRKEVSRLIVYEDKRKQSKKTHKIGKPFISDYSNYAPTAYYYLLLGKESIN